MPRRGTTPGLDGSGITIGVIDFFDVDLYWNEDEHGPPPVANVTAQCFDHGGDCTTAFFDGRRRRWRGPRGRRRRDDPRHGPGARVFIGQAARWSDYRRLVDWFVDRRTSTSSVDRWAAGTTAPATVAARSTTSSTTPSPVERLWVNSAGNNGRDKYYRQPVTTVRRPGRVRPDRRRHLSPVHRLRRTRGHPVGERLGRPAPRSVPTTTPICGSRRPGAPAAGTVVATSLRRQQLGRDTDREHHVQSMPVGGLVAVPRVALGRRRHRRRRDRDPRLRLRHRFVHLERRLGRRVRRRLRESRRDLRRCRSTRRAAGKVASYSSQGPSNDGRTLPDLVAPADVRQHRAGTVRGHERRRCRRRRRGRTAPRRRSRRRPGLAGRPGPPPHRRPRRPGGPTTRAVTVSSACPDPPTAAVDATPSRFVALDVPTRALDTRPGSAIGPTSLVGPVERGDDPRPADPRHRRRPDDRGHGRRREHRRGPARSAELTCRCCPTLGAPLGGYSNLNVDTGGQTRANFAIIPVGADGAISLYSIADGTRRRRRAGLVRARAGRRRRRALRRTPDRPTDPRHTPGLPRRTDGRGRVAIGAHADGCRPGHVAALVVTVTAAESSSPRLAPGLPDGPTGRHREDVDGEHLRWRRCRQHGDRPRDRWWDLHRGVLRRTAAPHM